MLHLLSMTYCIIQLRSHMLRVTPLTKLPVCARLALLPTPERCPTKPSYTVSSTSIIDLLQIDWSRNVPTVTSSYQSSLSYDAAQHGALIGPRVTL